MERDLAEGKNWTSSAEVTWCPGCGNFGILNALKQALVTARLEPWQVVVVGGIGQAGKVAQYVGANFLHGLHGRAIPHALGVKLANPELKVIAVGGDGDMYGEGGNHLLHAFRRNPDIVCLVHNNGVYGLTKGQASPTSQLGFKTPVQVAGVILEPFNPMAVAISLNAGFVARAYIRDKEQTAEILKKAIAYEGYALVDILQPCVTFNKINTYEWFKENTYHLDDSHDPHDRNQAFQKAVESDKLPLGIFYINSDKKPFDQNIGTYEKDKRPLFERERDFDKLQKLIGQFALSA